MSENIVLDRETIEKEKETLQGIALSMANEVAALEQRTAIIRMELGRMEGQITRLTIILQQSDKESEEDKDE